MVRTLSKKERVKEISRMIAGEKGMDEAAGFAENLLKEFLK